jgi:type IV pilus assembly protein PilE
MESKSGFTLIELLVVIAIVAILSVFAYPSYQSHIIYSRRADAQTELLKAQLKQSNFYILGNYSNTVASVGLPMDHHYYTFSIVSAGKKTYLMKAVAKMGTTQSNDEVACQTLFIDQDSKHTSNGSTDNDQCW